LKVAVQLMSHGKGEFQTGHRRYDHPYYRNSMQRGTAGELVWCRPNLNVNLIRKRQLPVDKLRQSVGELSLSNLVFKVSRDMPPLFHWAN